MFTLLIIVTRRLIFTVLIMLLTNFTEHLTYTVYMHIHDTWHIKFILTYVSFIPFTPLAILEHMLFLHPLKIMWI